MANRPYANDKEWEDDCWEWELADNWMGYVTRYCSATSSEEAVPLLRDNAEAREA